MGIIAVYILVLIFSTAIWMTTAVLIIRKIIVWEEAKSDSDLSSYFSDRISYFLSSEPRQTIDYVKAGFETMMKRSRKFGRYGRKRKRQAARRVLLEMSEEIVGENLEFVRQLFNGLGFAEESIRELESRHWWRRAEALRELRLMRTREGLDEAYRLLADPAAEVRLLAFEAVLEIDRTSSFPILAGSLRAMTPWDAINVAKVILEYRKEAATYVLPLVRHTDVSIRLFAVRMLGILKSIDAVPTLVGLAQAGRTSEVREALLALGRIGDERGVALCGTSLSNGDAGVRAAAAVALGNFGSAASLSSLLPLLSDPVDNARLAAAQAIAKLGGPGVAALETAAAKGSDAGSLAASHALDDVRLNLTTPISVGDIS